MAWSVSSVGWSPTTPLSSRQEQFLGVFVMAGTVTAAYHIYRQETSIINHSIILMMLGCFLEVISQRTFPRRKFPSRKYPEGQFPRRKFPRRSVYQKEVSQKVSLPEG